MSGLPRPVAGSGEQQRLCGGSEGLELMRDQRQCGELRGQGHGQDLDSGVRTRGPYRARDRLIDTLDLARLPVLERTVLREQYRDFINPRHDPRTVFEDHTSGSTGVRSAAVTPTLLSDADLHDAVLTLLASHDANGDPADDDNKNDQA